MPKPKPLDDPKLYVKKTVAELIEMHDKLAKSYNENLERLKQVQERLEKE
jgi:ribosomal protein S17E